MSASYDVCVIGSGAGGGAAAAALAEAGKRVLILEKGPWFDPETFYKDEIVATRREILVPDPRKEPVVEESADAGLAGAAQQQSATFWNGSLVGGSSVLMSGFFMRQKPDDFRMLSVYGPPPRELGIHMADWPIDYDELEPYYDRVEKELGVSGRVDPGTPATLRDRRSSAALPQPPTKEHPFAADVERATRTMGLHAIPLPRAVLSRDFGGRKKCDDNGFCGYSVCTTNAKGSALAGWIPRAVAAGAEIRPHAMARNLVADASGRSVTSVEYFDREGRLQRAEARAFVVACQAIESARLLLNSNTHPKHAKGLANGSGLLGRNLLFATYGAGWGDFPYGGSRELRERLRSPNPFVNRIVQDYYWSDPQDPSRNAGNTPARHGMVPGGTINFLLPHPYPIGSALNQAFEDHVDGRYGPRHERPTPLWGARLKKRLHYWFNEQSALKFELFGNWWPHEKSYVTLASRKDYRGIPVAHVRAFSHAWSMTTASGLAQRAVAILREMGAVNPRTVRRFGGPSTNLIGGTCRFGDDPKTSVLDRDCRAHEVDNLYVTDGSFMPTGGRVPFTFTIYANALRVAEVIARRL